MNCRSSYQPDDTYEPLRLPNNMGQNTNMMGEMPMHDFTQRYANTFPTNPGYPQQPPQQMQQQVVASQQTQQINLGNMTPTSGQTRLSADASEFVPNFSASSSGAVQGRLDRPQQQYQPGPYFVQQQHQQAQQQRFFNGYQQQKDHHGQQQYQSYSNSASVGQLANSVQDRLRISGGGGVGGGGVGIGGGGGHKQHHQGAIGSNSHHQGAGSSGNYYQQQQQQQSHHSNKHFQKHPHLNHYQQHHQQHQQRGHHQHNQHHHQQQQQQQQHHHQHHHQHNQDYYSNSSGAGASASSGNSSASTTTTSTTENSSSSHPDMETIALEYLDTVIHCLNQNPGQFDAIAPRFLTIFEGMETNNYVLSIAMEDIFEKSIENPNFRYMGAKLYNLLHMMNPKKDSLFHTLLKCKLDFHQEEVCRFIESNQQHKVRETALFLAELYMQLRGDDSRIHLIAENIVYSLKQLLAKENSENVRCICLTLKLAGFDLTADCPDDMKDIIAQLDMINTNSPGKYPLAANVIALQKNNWGRKVSNSLGEGESAKPVEPPRMSDEPVFYGPDGRELTAEETDFLAEDGAGGDDDDDELDDDDDDDGGELDPEMDEETERAYKDFRKQAKQAAAFSKS